MLAIGGDGEPGAARRIGGELGDKVAGEIRVRVEEAGAPVGVLSQQIIEEVLKKLTFAYPALAHGVQVRIEVVQREREAMKAPEAVRTKMQPRRFSS
jgi:hypothetical protein